jgi:hypothetical protein
MLRPSLKPSRLGSLANVDGVGEPTIGEIGEGLDASDEAIGALAGAVVASDVAEGVGTDQPVRGCIVSECRACIASSGIHFDQIAAGVRAHDRAETHRTFADIGALLVAQATQLAAEAIEVESASVGRCLRMEAKEGAAARRTV